MAPNNSLWGDEEERLKVLRAQDILDTLPETGFDDIVRLAARLCDTPVALISFVESDRQWFKARIGFEPCQTPIEQSVCKHALGQQDLLVIPNLTLDPRTRSNPLVLEAPHLRFYAGAPLVTAEGMTLGTICVIDHAPRPAGLTDVQAEDLRALARQVMSLLEMRHLAASSKDLLLQAQKSQKLAEHEHLRLTSMFEQTPSFMALLKGPDHVFELANPAYRRLVGNRDVIGKTVVAALPDAAQQGYVTLLDQVYHSGQAFVQKGAPFAVQTGPGTAADERYLDFVYQPMTDADGIVTGIFVEGSDVTEHVRQTKRVGALADLGEQLRDMRDADDIARAAARCLADAIGGSCIGFGKVDLEKEMIDIPVDWYDPTGVSVVGSHNFRSFGSYIEDLKRGKTVVIPDVAADVRTAAMAATLRKIHAKALLNLPIMDRGVLDTVIFILNHKARAWTPDDIDFVQQVGDRTHMAIARVRAEHEQHILNEELSHRMKNTLAIVQVIAGQTLREVAGKDAVNALKSRITALSRAHDVLLSERWASANLKDVVQASLSAFDVATRFEIDGPSLQIGPRATLSLSLLLHELATNAVKYGALSVPGGKVAIAWRIDRDATEEVLRMTWTEVGGPPAYQPSRTGFGSRLIDLGLTGTGGVDLRYTPLGLIASMEAPLSQMQQP